MPIFVPLIKAAAQGPPTTLVDPTIPLSECGGAGKAASPTLRSPRYGSRRQKEIEVVYAIVVKIEVEDLVEGKFFVGWCVDDLGFGRSHHCQQRYARRTGGNRVCQHPFFQGRADPGCLAGLLGTVASH